MSIFLISYYLVRNMLHGCLFQVIEIHKLKDLCLCASCIALSITLGESHV